MFDSDYEESDSYSYNGRNWMDSYESLHHGANCSYDSLPQTDYGSDMSPFNYYDSSENLGYSINLQTSQREIRAPEYPLSNNSNRLPNNPIGRHSSSKCRYKFDQKRRRFHKFEIELEASPRLSEYYSCHRQNKARHPFRSTESLNRKPKPLPKPVSSSTLAQDERRTLHNIQEQNRRLAIKRLLKRMQTMYPEHLKCDVLGDTYTTGQELTNPQTMRCLERYVKIIADYYDEYEYLKEEVKRLKKILSSSDASSTKKKSRN